MDSIRMVDLQKQYLRIKSEIDEAIQSVLASTAFIQGPQVAEFAEALARRVGADHVVTCANGTDALQISMMALGLRPGDEVIVPVHTYVATAEAIALLGLTPVFVDVNEDTFNIDVDLIERSVTKKTKAIVPVHLYGQCAEMNTILKIAGGHSLHVIEDAAQSLGAFYRFPDGTRRAAGTMGTIGTTSFFPSKNLGCYGDGGAMFASNETIASHLRLIANHGQRVKYRHDVIGVNSRLDTLQAAILQVKLKHLDEYEERRREVAEFYDRNLTSDLVIKPFRVDVSTHVFHQYTLKVRNGKRDQLQQHLSSKGIPTMIYYPVPLHLQPAYRQAGLDEGAFPVAESLAKSVISIPIHTEMDREQMNFICQTINEFA